MLTLRVTPQAVNHLYEIGLYTEQKWGRNQRRAYLERIDARFQWLCENWHLGQKRDDLKKGYLSYFHEHHMIFYRVNNNDLEIIGVLHGRREFGDHL